MNRRTFLEGGAGLVIGSGVIKLTQEECDRTDCRLVAGMSMCTLLGWTPSILDRDGNVVQRNRDPNTCTTTYNCATCGKSFARQN